MAGFLDLFDVVDSDGASATRYRLYFPGSPLSRQDSWIFGMLTELIYVAFQIVAVLANALLGTVLDSPSWLGALGDLYRRITAPIFAVFPPWAFALLGLAIVAVSAFREHPLEKDNSWGRMFDMGSDTLNRVGGALAMTATVLVLTNNPFALVSKLLDLANGFSAGLAAELTRSGNDSVLTAGQALVDASIRTPTIALNYGGELSATCRAQWSQAMIAGQELSESTGCFAEGSNVAGPGSLTTVVLMLILPAIPMLVFSVIAAWKYLLHLLISVGCLLATGYVAAISVHRRRGFERLTKTFAYAVAHLLIAVIVSMLAIALPSTVAGVGMQLLETFSSNTAAQPFVLMVSLGLGFAFSAWAIMKVAAYDGLLVRLLDADATVTMNKVFGMDTKRITERTKTRTNVIGDFRKDKKASGAGGAGKKPVLAEDPVAATGGARKSGGADTPPAPDRESGVGQLIAPAQSVAEAASGGTTPGGSVGQAAGAAAAAAVGAAAAGPASGVIQLVTGGSATAEPGIETSQTAKGDAHGYYFRSGDGDGGGGDASPFTGADGTTSSGGATVESPGETQSTSGGAPTDAGAVTVSALADPPRSVPAVESVAPPLVVGGIVGAYRAVEELARKRGVAIVAGVKAKTQRPRSVLAGLFSKSPQEAPPKGAFPEPQYAPPLGLATPPPVVTQSTGEAGQPVVLNDQQRWNMRDRGFRGDRTGPPARPAESGSEPAPVENPGTFMVDPPDFLAADAANDQIEEAKARFGAAGIPVHIEIDVNDRRLGLDLSSDPDERIRRSGGSGFGDHE